MDKEKSEDRKKINNIEENKDLSSRIEFCKQNKLVCEKCKKLFYFYKSNYKLASLL